MSGAVRSSTGEPSMSDYIWTSIVSLLLLIYLLYALLKPEKF
jgi:K+-transporting ATPase KdpF subunit